MARIDVTDLYIDPDVGGETFEVIRREQRVNNSGELVMVEFNPVPGGGMVFGSVYPTPSPTFRVEGFTTALGSMTVVTNFRLRSATKDGPNRFEPDLVVWGGDRYMVQSVKDYSQYGAGFIEAEMTSMEFVDTAPSVLPPVIGVLDFSQPAQSGLIGAI